MLQQQGTVFYQVSSSDVLSDVRGRLTVPGLDISVGAFLDILCSQHKIPRGKFKFSVFLEQSPTNALNPTDNLPNYSKVRVAISIKTLREEVEASTEAKRKQLASAAEERPAEPITFSSSTASSTSDDDIPSFERLSNLVTIARIPLGDVIANATSDKCPLCRLALAPVRLETKCCGAVVCRCCWKYCAAQLANPSGCVLCGLGSLTPTQCSVDEKDSVGNTHQLPEPSPPIKTQSAPVNPPAEEKKTNTSVLDLLEEVPSPGATKKMARCEK